MVEVRGAAGGESQSWLEGWGERLREWYGDFSAEPDWVRSRVEASLTRWSKVARRHLFTLADSGQIVGQLALAEVTDPPAVMLIDLWVRPELRRAGHGRAALDWAQEWAARHADQLILIGRGGDPAQEALFGHIATRALTMMKPLTPNGSWKPSVTGRAMLPHEFGPWRAAQEVAYVDEIVASGIAARAEAQARAAEQFDQLLPDGLATENQSFLCVEAEGAVVATNWLAHRYAPATSFVYGVDVHASYRGKGYGRAAMRLGEQASLAAGDTQLALNVFGQNEVAIGLYDSMGYRAVEKIRSLQFGS